MDQETSPTDAFEAHMESGRKSLSEARDSYATLEMMQTVPDSIVEAIGDLERELDELDRTLDVTAEDVRIAEQTSKRAAVLADVFVALEERQRIVVSAEITRLQSYASAITEIRRDDDQPEKLDSQFDRLNRRLEMLQKLADSGRYGQVVSNDRISPGTIDANLRDLELALTDKCPTDTRATTYLTVCEDLLEKIYDTPTGLDDGNEDKTAFSTDLGIVKDQMQDANSALEDDAPDQAVEHARVALEGAFMLHRLTTEAGAKQYLAEHLASIIRDADGLIDCDIEQCVTTGDADTLLSVISEVVDTQIERSVGERLAQLLREHDGSVIRTADATDFEVTTIVDHLDQLYQQHQISDIEVVFE
jgi:hypothetical protein